MSAPTCGANCQCAVQIAATSAASRACADTPNESFPCEMKRGNTRVPRPITGTPRESSASTVAGRSRMLFAPALTTAVGVRASAARSALMSGRSVQPRCTPPMPPVANTRMLALAQAASVAATVVPPLARCALAAPRSRVLSLRTSRSWPRRSSCARLSPTCSVPSSMPTVAGTAPPLRTVVSSSTLSARFAGISAIHSDRLHGDAMGVRGKPCVSTAVSSATIGSPDASASHTSSEISMATRGPIRCSLINHPLRVRTTPPRRFIGMAEGTTPPGNALGSAAFAAVGATAVAMRLLALADSSRRRFSASR